MTVYGARTVSQEINSINKLTSIQSYKTERIRGNTDT